MFSAILSFIFLKNSYGENYNDFNQNVKNYNKVLSILDEDAEKIAEYKVAVADNKEDRGYGLMNIKHLDSKKGMLFLLNQHAIISMWMKNTLIPLDMLFIKGDEIVWISENTTPESLNHISSKFKIDKVLEINAGEIEKWGIEIGNRIKL